MAYDCNNNVLLYCYLTQTAKRRGVGWADSRGDACLQFKARQFKVGALMFQLNHRFSQYTTVTASLCYHLSLPPLRVATTVVTTSPYYNLSLPVFAGVSFHQPVVTTSPYCHLSVTDLSVLPPVITTSPYYHLSLPPLCITTCRYRLSVLPPVVTTSPYHNTNTSRLPVPARCLLWAPAPPPLPPPPPPPPQPPPSQHPCRGLSPRSRPPRGATS